MRFFLALDIPDQNKKEILAVQRQLKELIPETKLTDFEKLHLTIAFIGEQDDSIKDALVTILEKSSEGLPPFLLTPAYIDGFPNLHTAHIFWMGIKGDIDKLFILRERIKDGLIKLGVGADERRFVPHIAIAKITNFELREGEERGLEKIDLMSLSPIPVSSVKLYQSIPNHGFHNHNTLAEILLK